MNNLAVKSCTCNTHKPHLTTLATTEGFDPTRTLTLRNAFAREMGKRFRQFRGIIRRALVEEDVLGLITAIGNIIILAELSTPGREAFDFPRSGDKVAAFTEWIEKQQAAGILEVSERVQLGTAIEDAWTNKFIDSAYQKGVERARQELIKAGHNVPSIEASGGIEIAFNQPFHLDRVGLLHTRVFNNLKGITAQMDTQISNVLAQSMAEGKNPREIARLLTRTIKGPVGDLGITDTLGRFIPAERRAKILARTEVIRAHADAQIQEFKNWRVAGVSVKAEFVTAGDDRVCAICEGLEGQTFTLEQAEGLIPVHPQCFPGDVNVSNCNDIAGLTKRWYQGKLIRFKTEKGIELACTENHPIATPYGFVPAKDLSLNQPVLRLRNIVDGQTIAEITHEYSRWEGTKSKEITCKGEEFHGDVAYGDEAVVWELEKPKNVKMIDDAELLRKIKLDRNVDLMADKIVSISTEYADCHVYNLQTGHSWFAANGIITHNCRCTFIPLPPER